MPESAPKVRKLRQKFKDDKDLYQKTNESESKRKKMIRNKKEEKKGKG